MDLRNLRHVVALARHLSYRKAAEELGLSQSALSRSIQAVEQRADVRLFDRDRGGVHLTAVGRVFADRAAALLREADELDRVVRRHASGAQGEIAFGMAPLLAAALAPAALCEALIAAPDLRTHVLVRSAEALLPLLLSEQIEFLVCSERQLPDQAPVKAALVGRFPTSLLVRAGHPLLAPGAAVDAVFPLITSAPFVQQKPATVDVPFLQGPPHVLLEDHAALLRITERSDAVWLSSSYGVADEIAAGRIRELPEGFWPQGRGVGQFRVMMCSLDRRSLSPAALKLKAQFRARIAALASLLSQAPRAPARE
jgi:DNA-binding transcriptional LysR family regulator